VANDAELGRRLTNLNPWWRGSDWELSDRDLREAAEAPFDYHAGALDNIEHGGLYFLLGPRRAGKSVEMKKAISSLIREEHVQPRRIIYFSCDGLAVADIHRLVRVARNQMTPTVDGPRYWFLDEITGADKGWPGAIKHQRELSEGIGDDCVVLTGSSMRDLAAARKALAGRRGKITNREKYLFPLSFRRFVRIVSQSNVPEIEPIPARHWCTSKTRKAVLELMPWLDELASLWEVYCTIGGYPRAIADYMTDGAVSAAFVQDLWDVIHGEALARTAQTVTPTQTDLILSGISSRLTQPMNFTGLAATVGYASHHTAEARLDALDTAYLTWRCHPANEKNLTANTEGTQPKTYFTDPLLARLAALKSAGFDPDTSAITEQQIGHFLLRQRETEQMGAVSSFTELLSYRTPSKKEIDFVSRWMEGIVFEGKYVDDRLKQERRTVQSQIDAGVFTGGVLATRAELDMDSDVWAVPAALIAWLLLD
jgi:predicted AAA+ superfamily ATPase